MAMIPFDRIRNALIPRIERPLTAREKPRPRKDVVRYRGSVSGVTAAGPGMANLQVKLDHTGRQYEGGQPPTIAVTVPLSDVRGREIGDRMEWIGRHIPPGEEEDE